MNRFGDDDFYPRRRFEIPTIKKEYESPYDIDSQELQDLVARKQSPFYKQTLNLTTSSITQFGGNGWLEVPIPGQGVVIYGSDGSAIRTVNTTPLVWVQFNALDVNLLDQGSATPNAAGGFPMKHARGFRGPFWKLFLNWPAQNGVWIDLIVLANKELPWVDGESCT